MFVELLEVLRCPNPHAESPLVATAARTVDRRIVDGRVGCPVCGAEFGVVDGLLELRSESESELESASESSSESERGSGRALRIGALLGLDARGGLYVLDAGASRHIAELAELSPGSRFVALSGAAGIEGADLVISGSGAAIPLAAGCVRGVALDRDDPELVRAAVRVLAGGGRLVAPASAAVPAGVAVLAEDAEQWVAEREERPALAALRRAPRPE